MCPVLYPQYMQGSAVCTLLRSQYSQHPRKSDAAVFSLLPSVGSTKNAVDRRMEAPWKHQIWRRGRYFPSHPQATNKRRVRMSISDLLLLLEQDVLSQLHSWRHLPPPTANRACWGPSLTRQVILRNESAETRLGMPIRASISYDSAHGGEVPVPRYHAATWEPCSAFQAVLPRC
jgi:hypothetical protein